MFAFDTDTDHSRRSPAQSFVIDVKQTVLIELSEPSRATFLPVGECGDYAKHWDQNRLRLSFGRVRRRRRVDLFLQFITSVTSPIQLRIASQIGEIGDVRVRAPAQELES